jgi:hypothetical protein
LVSLRGQRDTSQDWDHSHPTEAPGADTSPAA